MNEKKLTLTEHLIELRQRLIYCLIALLVFFVISYNYAENLYALLLKPLEIAYGNSSGKRLIYTNLTEAFTTYIKLSFISALFLSIPIIILQIYLFMAPGLYKHEKKNILLILFFSPLLFLAGAALVYFFIAPLAFKFFLGFQNNMATLPIELEARISEYLDLVTSLIFAFGTAFQLPILLIFLVKLGLITVEGLKKKRKYWIVIIFTIAAFITPPDVLSQISLAIPMYLLYEIAIIVSSRINQNKPRS